jgi:type II secretory pathway pseudopilin PulG
MRRLREEDGFQLVEVLVVIFLMGIIGSAISSVVMSGMRMERVTDELRTNLDQARVAAERMRLDLREARRVSSVNGEGLTASTTQLPMWRDLNQDQLPQAHEEVTYRIAAQSDGTGNLERRTAADPPGQWRVIARRLDMSKSRFTTSPAPPNTRRASLELTVTARPGANAKSLSITETVRLRNAR